MSSENSADPKQYYNDMIKCFSNYVKQNIGEKDKKALFDIDIDNHIFQKCDYLNKFDWKLCYEDKYIMSSALDKGQFDYHIKNIIDMADKELIDENIYYKRGYDANFSLMFNHNFQRCSGYFYSKPRLFKIYP